MLSNANPTSHNCDAGWHSILQTQCLFSPLVYKGLSPSSQTSYCSRNFYSLTFFNLFFLELIWFPKIILSYRNLAILEMINIREHRLTPLGFWNWFFELIKNALAAQALKTVSLGQPSRNHGFVKTTSSSSVSGYSRGHRMNDQNGM